jgi:uncharacterized protein (DUF4415 family)
MKNSGKPRSQRRSTSGLAREYRFDYSKSRPNRFATRFPKDAVVVVLDSDVAKVFRDPKRVNKVLRATIAALKKKSKKAG